ncbi:DnaT-like ssDNA-binding domain-containing protein [Serratia rubidaea]|uniref:DnaT-like ssDNA-binding domain-containing protein n=1 Tax=Serratia rubidaea TaxID=61652 RepID=UPI00242A4BEF|nr:DnaT-like ssDNA-binding domain-containing protein [Serratia rubidaea]MCR0998682.1 DnaT-like ssDNA-binding domain-containing protein [Serratia rubidaea]
MRDYGKVHTSFWSSDDMRNLSDDAKTLALYLLTGQHTNMIGCFRLPDGYITEDVNWPLERVSEGLRELSEKGFITRNPKSKWVFITNFMRWNTIDNVNQAVSALKLFGNIPDEFEAKPAVARVFVGLLSAISEHKNGEKIKGWETVVKPFANRSVTSSSSSSSSSSRINPHSNAREENPPLPAEQEPPPFPLNGNNFGKFTMRNGWQPGDDFQRMAATWGMKITEPVTPEELQEFIGYWEPEGKAFHQAQWEQKLARSVLMSRARKTTGVKNHERGQRPDGTTGHWRGNAAEGVYAALADQLRADGCSESQIRKILDENDGDLFGQVDSEERPGTVVTLEAGDYSAH